MCGCVQRVPRWSLRPRRSGIVPQGGREGSEVLRCSAAHQQVVIVPAHAYEHEHVYEYKHEYAYGNSNRPFETYPFKLPLAW